MAVSPVLRFSQAPGQVARMTINALTPALPLVFAVALASCGSPIPEAEEPRRPTEVCNAADFEYLQGEPIDAVASLNTGLQVRVLGPDDFVPRDFDPNRLTFTETPDGNVSRIFCG